MSTQQLPPDASDLPPGSRPLVSVIIPCHNYGRYLAEAVGSVLGQTHTAVEVIIVDDGSQDNSGAVAARLGADPRVRLLAQAQGGISKARNTGLAAGTGRYVIFLDADDCWPQADQLARQVAFLETHAEYGWIFGDARPFDETGYTSPSYLQANGYYQQECAAPRPWELTVALLCQPGFFLPTGTVLLRRTCLERVGGFDETLRMFEDIDMWVRLVDQPLAFIAQNLLARREHGANAGRERFVRTADLETLFAKHRLAERGVAYRAAMQQAYYLEGRHYLQCGDRVRARQALGKSLRHGLRPKTLGLYCGTFAPLLPGRLARRGGAA